MEKRPSRILPANAALVAIGLVDLFTTLFWLRAGIAIEVNPIMAAVLRCGLSAFIGLKLATLVAYLAVMEWYRRCRSASFARSVARITLASYLAIYTISFACVNGAILFG